MKCRNGFTLIELMVVILIIAILAGISVPIYSAMVDKAIIAEAKAALGVLKRQLECYYLENGCYPDSAVEFANSDYYDSSGIQCTYVDDSCFDYKNTGDGYQLYCTSKYAGDSSNVAGTYHQASKIETFKNMDITITLDSNGDFTIDSN